MLPSAVSLVPQAWTWAHCSDPVCINLCGTPSCLLCHKTRKMSWKISWSVSLAYRSCSAANRTLRTSPPWPPQAELLPAAFSSMYTDGFPHKAPQCNLFLLWRHVPEQSNRWHNVYNQKTLCSMRILISTFYIKTVFSKKKRKDTHHSSSQNKNILFSISPLHFTFTLTQGRIWKS